MKAITFRELVPKLRVSNISALALQETRCRPYSTYCTVLYYRMVLGILLTFRLGCGAGLPASPHPLLAIVLGADRAVVLCIRRGASLQ